MKIDNLLNTLDLKINQLRNPKHKSILNRAGLGNIIDELVQVSEDVKMKVKNQPEMKDVTPNKEST